MAESPVTLEKLCVDGLDTRKKLSWSGLKLLGKIVCAVVTATAAVLAVYYSAEASQNAGIADMRERVTAVEVDHESLSDRTLSTFVNINQTLTNQSDLIRQTRDAVTANTAAQTVLNDSIRRELTTIQTRLDYVNDTLRRGELRRDGP